MTCLVDALLQGSKGKLVVEQIENIGPREPTKRGKISERELSTDMPPSVDYARTLREWRRRFEATFEAEIVPALREAYPELTTRKGIDVFRRKWICE